TDGQLGRPLPAPAQWVVRIAGVDHAVQIAADGVAVDGEPMAFAAAGYAPGDRLMRVETDAGSLGVRLKRTRTGYRLTARGASHVARVLPAHVAPFAHHLIEKVPPDLSRFLLCPMPGLLVRLDVGAGDTVEAGQPLAVVEAMKMENILRAGKSGTVKALSAAMGDSLSVDQVILELE
ncbi:biotin/lipoyl-containing protein, partial [Sphingomonas bacterium]|uniref:biotin/lipoyl-containing protein n=1 Tax=Sphingomonas bacterium TaxID=1895847 RepID=UPI00266F7405